ncbi:hypothetical protein [Bradyrhizobium sp.]|jgi:hypothetical protein|uniref:hypothetical protein n=1 Tax=Bradyrhizobium sp. TaxID=376 RepID=UPI003D0A9222
MTAASSDALSHRLWRRRWKAVLPGLPRQAFRARSSVPDLLHQVFGTKVLGRSESTACAKPETGVTVTHADHRSTLKCMVGMSPKRERFAAASYSICALLAEVSASPPMTSLFSINRYYMVNKFLIVSVTNRRSIICTR